MRLTHLSLTNFRNYGRLELDFPAGPTLLYGENAQGKTNLLEALYYLATTRSPQASQDSQLLNWEASQQPEPVIVGRLVAQIATHKGSRLIEMRLIQEEKGRGQTSFRREALVNRRKVRLMDLLGQLQVVLFLPEDVQLITGPPSQRRRYVDITLCQVDNHYCRTLSRYNKVLEQRNALLRQIAEGQSSAEVLPIFTERLAELGGQVFARRAQFFTAISRDTQRIHYEELTGGRETLRLHYAPRLSAEQNGSSEEIAHEMAAWLEDNYEDTQAACTRFASALDAARGLDLARGATTVGPHRDDWYFWVNGRNLSDFGSRGQQRTAILALRMAEIDWMARMTGETPILLLDEVVAELDERRRDLLLRYVQNVEQALLTATDPAMFTGTFLERSTTMNVADGQVHLDSTTGETPEAAGS